MRSINWLRYKLFQFSVWIDKKAQNYPTGSKKRDFIQSIAGVLRFIAQMI